MPHSLPEPTDERERSKGPSAEDAAESDDFKSLTAEQASEWRSRQPQASVWRVVRWQGVLLLLVTVLTVPFALVWGQPVWVVSVFYGGLCVLLPTALMAYGLTASRWAQRRKQQAGQGAGDVMAGVFFWEGIKILLAVAMLALAPRLIPDLSWLGLLLGLVLVLKAYGLAFWLRSRAAA
ncbi:ATP synthase subunit I [Serpentinimonas maccroryi]|uniref:ATP synthase subunit I n=1 Tax=Serpentinimonas maccroryi TaxID=1458426 RepID=UPI002034344D|nr:ATP synthase subunit I [Serpentinimonas maccroryi]MCM2479233.1 ATP synthase subunit I [Serpentinimonas maccroryi]